MAERVLLERGGEEKLAELPEHLRGGLLAYVLHGIQPGGFLCAVIENDLCEAVCRADSTSLPALPAAVRWLYQYAPGPCWGSLEKRHAWQRRFVDEHLKRALDEAGR